MSVNHISGTVKSVGRKWIKFVIDGKNKDYPDNLLINELSRDFEPGQHVDNLLVITESEQGYRGGWKFTHTPVREEDVREEGIRKWWGFVQKTWNEDGNIYGRGVSELHQLNCYEYDEQIAKWTQERDLSNAIFYIRKTFKEDGYLYQKGIDTLAKYKCHEYDEEIAKMREEVRVNEAWNKFVAIRDRFKKYGYVNEHYLSDLHGFLKCHEYDDQIAAMYADILTKEYTQCNYIREKTINKLHKLGNTEFDAQIREMLGHQLVEYFEEHGNVYEHARRILEHNGWTEYNDLITEQRNEKWPTKQSPICAGTKPPCG